jgi:hypothetical protein
MTNSTVQPIETMGINPKFKKVKAFLSFDFPGADSDWEKTQLPQLQRFSAEGNRFPYSVGAYDYKYNLQELNGDMLNVALGWRTRAFKAALAGQPGWQAEWHRAVAYAYWWQRIECIQQRAYHASYVRKEVPQYRGTLALRHIAPAMVDCLLLGWQEQALDLARQVAWALPVVGFQDQGQAYHRRSQLFAWRVLCRWQGWPETPGSGSTFVHDQPVFNALLEHWDAPDSETIAPLLLAALDRHTHECVSPASKGEFDFKDPSYWYHPYEVLVVQKVRELKGLANPVLDHPLAATPLGQLPAQVPLYSDELLEGILAQMRTAYPDL